MKAISIAEIGINHHGSFEKAKRMCIMAYEAGADFVKGQYYNPLRVLGAKHPALQYAIQCQFTRQQHDELGRLAEILGIHYFVSVFSVGDLGWASQFGYLKIATRMNKNQEFIARVEQCKVPTFMSIQPELSVRIPDRFKLMWCIKDAYPSTKEEILKYPYNNFGLSSHCPDWQASLEAFNLGARVFENHVVESKDEEGCDVSSSIDFKDYEKLTKSIHQPITR